MPDILFVIDTIVYNTNSDFFFFLRTRHLPKNAPRGQPDARRHAPGEPPLLATRKQRSRYEQSLVLLYNHSTANVNGEKPRAVIIEGG